MITSSRACFQIPTLPPNKNTVREQYNFDKELPFQSTARSTKKKKFSLRSECTARSAKKKKSAQQRSAKKK
jgi:hypothetical protein